MIQKRDTLTAKHLCLLIKSPDVEDAAADRRNEAFDQKRRAHTCFRRCEIRRTQTIFSGFKKENRTSVLEKSVQASFTAEPRLCFKTLGEELVYLQAPEILCLLFFHAVNI